MNKKTILWLPMILIVISLMTVYVLGGCAPAEEAVEEEAVEEEAVTEVPVEEVPVEEEEAVEEVETVEEESGILNAGKFYGVDLPVGEVKEGPPVVAYIPWVYDPSDFYGVFHAGLQAGMDGNFGEGNWEMPMRIPANVDDHLGQLNIVEDMISQEVDYIVICPTSYEGQIELYRKVSEAEIPLFIFNYEKPFPAEWGVWAHNFAGYSHADGGKATAEYIAENYPEGTEMAIIHGTPIYTSLDRASTQLHKDNGMEVVAEEFADWSREKAFDIAQNLITAHPDLKIIYAVSSAMALAAVEAVNAAGKTGEIDVFGAGAIEEELKNIEEGTQKGSWFRNPFLMGENTAYNIWLHYNGRADEIPLTYEVPIMVVDSVEAIIEHVPPEIYTPGQ